MLIFKKLCDWFKSDQMDWDDFPLTVTRDSHILSRKNVSESALKVLYRLHKQGFCAYLVGGGVRDALLKQPTKDFDIVTNATPEQVRELFVNSRMIGRRFRLVHVLFKKEMIEVSTFRGESIVPDNVHEFVHQHNNMFGTIEEDAWRRDFTINALYYNIADFSIYDYTGGFRDLKSRSIRIIGDVKTRIIEDPIRMLRALRFAAKLNFSLEPKLKQVVLDSAGLLQDVAPARLFLEFEKLFLTGHAAATLETLIEYDYLKVLFKGTALLLQRQKNDNVFQLLQLAMRGTDERYKKQKSLSSGFLLAVMLWPVMQEHLLEVKASSNTRFFQALHIAVSDALRSGANLSIPKRYSAMISSVWRMQYILEKRRPKRIHHILRQRYFRASFDLLALRAECCEGLKTVYQWWAKIQNLSSEKQDKMINALVKENLKEEIKKKKGT